MSLKSNLMKEVDKGLLGKNGCIPFPVAKLDEYIEIAKNTNYLIVGDTGAGKSTFAQDLILNILDWYYLNQSDNLKLSMIYFGMERKLYVYSAKWVSRRIFLEEGIYIPIKKILGRKRKRDERSGRLLDEYDLLSKEEYEKVDFYSNIFNLWEKDAVFTCVEGTHNPTGMKIFIDNFAKEHGQLSEREPGPLGKQTYTPSHDNHIVLIITDYVGIVDEEKDRVTGEKKQTLDTYSKIMRRARDLYSFSPINVQQLNREVGSVGRIKLNDVKPKLTDIADTSQLGRDSDVAIAIFDPFTYLPEDITKDLLGYELSKLKNSRGDKYYRSLHILKNSFDANGVTAGAAFHPQTGIIKAMPKLGKDMQDEDYQDIVNGNYFLR